MRDGGCVQALYWLSHLLHGLHEHTAHVQNAPRLPAAGRPPQPPADRERPTSSAAPERLAAPTGSRCAHQLREFRQQAREARQRRRSVHRAQHCALGVLGGDQVALSSNDVHLLDLLEPEAGHDHHTLRQLLATRLLLGADSEQSRPAQHHQAQSARRSTQDLQPARQLRHQSQK